MNVVYILTIGIAYRRIIRVMRFNLERLITEARRGNKDAFGEIYNLFLDKIYRYVYFSVKNREIAEDVTQETFFKCWKALPTFSEKKGTLSSFLFAIARNLIIDLSRKKRAVSLELVKDYQLIDAKKVDEDIIQEEENTLLAEALSKLEEKEKHMVVLRFFEELSFAEIGKIMGKREVTVRVALHRIIKSVKAEIIRNEN